MSKVLVTDYTFDSLETERAILEPIGLRVDGAQCRTQQELLDRVGDVEYLMVQFAPVDATVIDALTAAKVIVRYGIGYDNVAIEAARKKGIPVCNIPDYCIDEVADHTLAFILAGTRALIPNGKHVAQGQWGRATPLERMNPLRDLTVGLLGFGRIGKEVAARLKPFKASVLVHDPAVDPALLNRAGVTGVAFDALLERSDVISLHCPALPSTRHLIREETIRQMKDGAVLINVARGSVVHTDDLTDALQSGKLAYAALDVLETEPPGNDHPLRSLDNVLLHSHLASSSPAAAHRLRSTAASIVAAAAQGHPLPNVVNL